MRHSALCNKMARKSTTTIIIMVLSKSNRYVD
jgi:hypothetical protein